MRVVPSLCRHLKFCEEKLREHQAFHWPEEQRRRWLQSVLSDFPSCQPITAHRFQIERQQPTFCQWWKAARKTLTETEA